MLDVGLSQLSRSQELGLLAAPGVEIAVVKCALCRHGRRLRRSVRPVYRRPSIVNTMRRPLVARPGLFDLGQRNSLGRDPDAAGRGRFEPRAYGGEQAVGRHAAEAAAHERDRRRAQDVARQRDFAAADRADLDESQGPALAAFAAAISRRSALFPHR